MEHANSLVGTARVGSRTRKCQRERRSSEQRSRNEEADEEADERAAVVVRQRREDSATTATDEGGERPRVTHIEPRRDLNGRSRSLCYSLRLCGRVLACCAAPQRLRATTRLECGPAESCWSGGDSFVFCLRFTVARICLKPRAAVRLLLVLSALRLRRLGLLSLDATGTTAAERAGQGKVNVHLAVGSDQERRDVDDLLANSARQEKREAIASEMMLARRTSGEREEKDIPDVSLPDEHAGVVDRSGEAELEDRGLEATLEEVLGGEREDVVELGLGLLENAVSVEAAQEGSTLEEALGVLLVEREELTSSLADLGELVVHSPHLALVAETVLSAEPELSVETLLFERASRRLVRLAVCSSERQREREREYQTEQVVRSEPGRPVMINRLYALLA